MRTWNRTETLADQLRKGPDSILEPDCHPCGGTFEVVVPYIGSELTGRAMERAAVLAAGLNVVLRLVAVYVAPYPADLDCPAAMRNTQARAWRSLRSDPPCLHLSSWSLLAISAMVFVEFCHLGPRCCWEAEGAGGILCFAVGWASVFVTYPAEQGGNPNLSKLGVESAPTASQPGGNMEGKEVRFGIANSALFAVITTDGSCGAVNSMHDSFTPLGG